MSPVFPNCDVCGSTMSRLEEIRVTWHCGECDRKTERDQQELELCKDCPESILRVVPLWKGSVVYNPCDGELIAECMQEARR